MARKVNVPSPVELSSLLNEMSERLYDGVWMPSLATYDQERPRGKGASVAADTLLRAYGLPATAEGWRCLVEMIVGRPVRPTGVAARETWQRRKNAELWGCDESPQPLPPSEQEQALDEGGLLARGRLREVRRWCWRRHKYLVVGFVEMFEVL